MEKPPKIETSITKLLQIDYPIIAAPMFLISDANLVVPVCQAGASGAFPALNFRPTEVFRKELQKIKSQTSSPFGVNIIMQDTNKVRDEQIEICLDEGVAYIISSLGNPTALVGKAHKKGTKVFCDVVSEKHARKAVDAGADGLVAVSSGAGGHSGDISPFALIPRLKREFSVPIIAAGSIVNGRTMLAALALGADAVYMGTRFIASEEADAPAEYKQAILEADIDDIINTDRVDGFAGNFIKTASFKKQVPDPGAFEKAFRIVPKLEKAWRLYKASKTLFGKPSDLKASYKTVFSAGHGVGLIDDTQKAAHIVHSIVHEYWACKKSLP